jgi:hypothetical protein
MVTVSVRLIDERRFDPPRRVEVEHGGQWWPGFQRAWRLCDDDRGWMADVEYGVRHQYGVGKHLVCVPPARVRIGQRRDDRCSHGMACRTDRCRSDRWPGRHGAGVLGGLHSTDPPVEARERRGIRCTTTSNFKSEYV